jgi:hypothetical protein
VARPRTCACGECKKCKDREKKRLAYQAMTPEERRAWRMRKDPLKRYVTNRRARRKHEAKYPEKAAARDALQRALRSGRVVRGCCEVCGVVHGTKRQDGTTVKVEAHHDDYSRPLDVRWVCVTHHRPPWVNDRG